MPRSERPLVMDGSTLTEFAADLRRLRRDAGLPPYRELAGRCHFSPSTIADAAGGRRLPSLDVTLAYVRACGGDPAGWQERWHTVRDELTDLPPVDDGAPYVGLDRYEPADTDRFAGREALVADLLARVERQRFTAVSGPSGAGTSSVLRAGLFPALPRAVLLTPGPHPMVALTEAVRDDTEVVVVDQFEELFTHCHSAAERDRFIAALDAYRVVIGVRADFHPHCAEHPRLAELMADAQVNVGAMTVDELRRVIVEPAAKARCTVEGALVATLTSEAICRPGSLPLLSQALLETWRRRAGNKLTLAGYHAAGGIAHALARTAESVYTDLTEPQRETARALFLRLTALGEATDDSARRVAWTELDGGPDHDAVVARLVEARLVVVDDRCVEIAHEALVRCWPRLRQWLTDDREAIRAHRMLTDATATWEAFDHDRSVLYRGTRLEQARLLIDPLTERERLFLAASERAAAHEAALVRRRARQVLQLMVAVVVCALVATVAVVAVLAQNTALRDHPGRPCSTAECGPQYDADNQQDKGHLDQEGRG
jgi:hypothetical protein